ncbi:hypothetical protein D3093_05895 [Azospirillum argentinense]|uniref:Uncharacterized protein n=1 Tax=Azospirillum argentinense TaxID=2970906 RepID=A0A4D8PJZ3_9PROT|nr:hypothetical protein D3093_05895 [Azospirillum argentinense]
MTWTCSWKPHWPPGLRGRATTRLRECGWGRSCPLPNPPPLSQGRGLDPPSPATAGEGRGGGNAPPYFYPLGRNAASALLISATRNGERP